MAEESIFPYLQPTAAAPAAGLPVLRECAWDFANDVPILRRGMPVVVERAEAVAVWAWNALHTERFLWPCFFADYGSEIYTLIGQGYQPETKRAEVQRYIEECLLACPYITAVTGMTVTGAGDRLTVSFTIRSIYGDLDMEVETDAG